MSLAGMEFKYSTLASICELFAGHDLIKGRGITVYFGKMPENWSAGLPVIRMVPTSDTYERGGPAFAGFVAFERAGDFVAVAHADQALELRVSSVPA